MRSYSWRPRSVWIECEGTKIFSYVTEVQTSQLPESFDGRWVTSTQGLACPHHVRNLVKILTLTVV